MAKERVKEKLSEREERVRQTAKALETMRELCEALELDQVKVLHMTNAMLMKLQPGEEPPTDPNWLF